MAISLGSVWTIASCIRCERAQYVHGLCIILTFVGAFEGDDEGGLDGDAVGGVDGDDDGLWKE